MRQPAIIPPVLGTPMFAVALGGSGGFVGGGGGGATSLADVLIDGGTPTTVFGVAVDNFKIDGGGP